MDFIILYLIINQWFSVIFLLFFFLRKWAFINHFIGWRITFCIFVKYNIFSVPLTHQNIDFRHHFHHNSSFLELAIYISIKRVISIFLFNLINEIVFCLIRILFKLFNLLFLKYAWQLVPFLQRYIPCHLLFLQIFHHAQIVFKEIWTSRGQRIYITCIKWILSWIIQILNIIWIHFFYYFLFWYWFSMV